MTALLQFDHVEADKVETLSFSIDAGELRILEIISREAKLAVIDLAMGELMPEKGVVSLLGQNICLSQPGNIGLVPASGGLISNLKAWENITLPLWYHGIRLTRKTEESVAQWLSVLNMEEQEWEKFMASPVARLITFERKLVGLLRGLILAPRVLLVDASLFDEVDEYRKNSWLRALEKFVHEREDRAVLVVANTPTLLPWKVLE